MPDTRLPPSPSPPLSPLVDSRASVASLVRRMALVTQAAGIGYWSVNRRDRRTRWSAELFALHGLPVDAEVPNLAQWLERFVHPDDRGRAAELAWHWMKEGGQAPLELGLRIVRTDGELRELLTHSLAENEDDTDLRFGVVIDVTPLRRAQQAQRLAEGRAALTANAVGIGTWEIDLATGEATWDDQMWLLRGMTPRASTASLEDRLSLIHPEDRERVREATQVNDSVALEFRVVWPDGQLRWLATRATTLHDDQGRPLRRIGVNWDITVHREAEAALRERDLALRESETRSRTLARMSHELRTPLNAILGCTQLLRESDADPRLRLQHLQRIEVAGRQLLELVDHVLDLTGEAPSAADAAPAPGLMPARPSPVPGADPAPRRCVLYVEDNSVNAMIVSELVARRGDLDVVIAETGAEGLAQAAALQPALVLLDMQLPDMDGAEVFRRLRADARTAALPCIALSANVLPEDIDAAMAAGMTDYWTKPLDFRAFARSLDRLFGPAPGR